MESYPGDDTDTLLLKEDFEMHKSNLKFDTFIENSAYDDTNKRILRECSTCGLNYMTLIRIGEQSKVMFTCICGARETNDGVVYKGSADVNDVNDDDNDVNDDGNDVNVINDTVDIATTADVINDTTNAAAPTITGASQVYKIRMESRWFDELKGQNLTTVLMLDEPTVGDIVMVRSDKNQTIKLLVKTVQKYTKLSHIPQDTLPGVDSLEEMLEILEKQFDMTTNDAIYAITFTPITHMMRMDNPWLQCVIDGKKTSEIRVSVAKFGDYQVGDSLVIYNDDDHVQVQLTAINHYKTAMQALKGETVGKVYPGIATVPKAKAILAQWATPALVRDKGLIAFEFKTM